MGELHMEELLVKLLAELYAKLLAEPLVEFCAKLCAEFHAKPLVKYWLLGKLNVDSSVRLELL